MRCDKCPYYYTEEDEDGNLIEFCACYDCMLTEIAGIDPEKGCIVAE